MQDKYQNIIINFKNFVEKNRFQFWVLGLSWGIDSSLTLKIGVDVLWKDATHALIMPDWNFSSQKNIDDAKNYAKQLWVKYEVINIWHYIKIFWDLGWNQNKIADMNLRARIRMLILYNYANSFWTFVLWTWNKTEIKLWYWTKYWDFWVDVEVLGDLYKTEVFEMAKFLWIPSCFINKKPSAELSENQSDEDEIWFSYEKIDNVLKRLEKWEKVEIEYEPLLKRIALNTHKSEPVPVIISNWI